MKYIIDHDYHIHSHLSICSNDKEQTPERMLEYAATHSLKKICITDHFWDDKIPGASDFYAPQNLDRIKKSLPLPKRDGIEFYFGCEAELAKNNLLGITRETIDMLDFVIIPTTHLHMNGFTIKENPTPAERAEVYVEKLDGLLHMDLPFHKIGIAHPLCGLIIPGGTIDRVVSLISDDTFKRLFALAAKKGAGIEINQSDFNFAKKTEEEIEQIRRVYGFAKDAGCKFYLGSDAHHPASLDSAIPIFENAISFLGITEDDKFRPFG
ncbi:MAG: PHP domain-containing protein [Clostridia bacterium]|nr:PHP domain-containing protein [Clostridia bacterium]